MTKETEPSAPQNRLRQRTLGTMSLVDLAKRAAVVWAVGVLIVLLVVGIGYIIEVFLLTFAGVLFAIVLRSVADLVRKTGLGEKGSVAAAILLVLGLVAAIIPLLAPSIAEQAGELQQSMPKSVEQLTVTLKRYQWGQSLVDKLPAVTEWMPKRSVLFSRITGVMSGTFQALGVLVVVFFSGLYFTVQPRLYIEGIVKLVTVNQRDHARDILREIGSALKWWLVGKMIAMVVVGFLTWVGLWLLGVKLALTLAVLAALLTFIPNFGPIIAAVPAILIGLLNSPMTAVWVVVLYVAIQTVESYLITPLIQQQTVSLPPALTITTQLAMAVFVGGVGLALASPLTVVMLILVQRLYVEDMLGDESSRNES